MAPRGDPRPPRSRFADAAPPLQPGAASRRRRRPSPASPVVEREVARRARLRFTRAVFRHDARRSAGGLRAVHRGACSGRGRTAREALTVVCLPCCFLIMLAPGAVVQSGAPVRHGRVNGPRRGARALWGFGRCGDTTLSCFPARAAVPPGPSGTTLAPRPPPSQGRRRGAAAGSPHSNSEHLNHMAAEAATPARATSSTRFQERGITEPTPTPARLRNRSRRSRRSPTRARARSTSTPSRRLHSPTPRKYRFALDELPPSSMQEGHHTPTPARSRQSSRPLKPIWRRCRRQASFGI